MFIWKTEQVLRVKCPGMGVEPRNEKLSKACGVIPHPLLQTLSLSFSLCDSKTLFYLHKFCRSGQGREKLSSSGKRDSNMEMKKQSRAKTRRLVLSGLFLALALVVRNFSYMVYIGGGAGMRISFAGVFSQSPAILFGPLYGGITTGLLDILGYLLKPEGAYIPWLTLTAILAGVLNGTIWRLVGNVNIRKLQRAFIIIFSLIGILGVINYLSVIVFKGNFWSELITGTGKYANLLSIGLIIISLIGIILLSVDIILKKKVSNKFLHDNYLKLLLTTGISGLVVTTINTYILRIFIPALGKTAFMVLLIPRVVEEIIMVVIQSYLLALLLSLYYKIDIRK